VTGGSKYTGRHVTRLRDYWRPRLPLPCWRCGRVLHATPEKGWTVGHLRDRALGGSIDDPSNTWPECPRCNFAAGGRLGAARTNAKRPKVVERRESERDRRIWGWP
jgi:hypothetical protein